MNRSSKERTYIAIDLKSFYASAECAARGLDPLDTNLVVADSSRTEKTICLAVSPPLKSFGIPGRARLFQVIRSVQEINALRRLRAPEGSFSGSSVLASELSSNPALELDYIVARPRMVHYIDVSAEIYRVYLKYIAPEDIHVYSIDEVFMDVSDYLQMYGMTARELAAAIMRDVLKETGITAVAGIGPNLYLAKVAMDIKAKKMPPDCNGARIAELDEMSYRKELWNHRPITDFWQIGRGYSRRLASRGIYTMGDIALCSAGRLYGSRGEDLLYRMFGVKAELLIDHAWGREPCTIRAIQNYQPSSRSVSSGQVLPKAYSFEKAEVIVKEMCDQMSLDLVKKHFMAEQISLCIGYESEWRWRNDPEAEAGTDVSERYLSLHRGSDDPGMVRGSLHLGSCTSSSSQIMEAVSELYRKIVDRKRRIRRVILSADFVVNEAQRIDENGGVQLNLFTDYEELILQKQRSEAEQVKEKNLQTALLSLQRKYHKNSVFRGMDLLQDATALERNRQIGGHRE